MTTIESQMRNPTTNPAKRRRYPTHPSDRQSTIQVATGAPQTSSKNSHSGQCPMTFMDQRVYTTDIG